MPTMNVGIETFIVSTLHPARPVRRGSYLYLSADRQAQHLGSSKIKMKQ
jgi:hypothetical protein